MLKSVNTIALLALASIAAPSLPQEPLETAESPLIEFESDSFSLIRSTNVMTFQGFRIDAGDWRLEADEASALATELDFESGEWLFDGNLRIAIGTALISAQSASFVFENQALVSGEMRGEPVVFEETEPKREGPVLGRAERIRYDSQAGTVQFIGKVALSVGPYDITGCDLIYFLEDEDFTTGSSDCPEPFTMIFSPSEAEDAEDDGSDAERAP